jgi:hypothetical protein
LGTLNAVRAPPLLQSLTEQFLELRIGLQFFGHGVLPRYIQPALFSSFPEFAREEGRANGPY